MSQEQVPHESNDNAVVEIDNVSVEFEQTQLMGLAKKEVIQAVDDVSLTIGENEVVALVGESGCGKTTLGKTAIGLQRPTSGSVRYRDQDIWQAKDQSRLIGRIRNRGDGGTRIPHQEIREALQIIHQDPGSALNSNYTVASELSAPMKYKQPELSAADRRARIEGLLEHVGMTPPEDYADRYPHQLSGGEQQRVALIRALLMNPDVILADEAISALDVSLRIEMMDLMLNLQEEFNTSYLFISHDLSNARYLAQETSGRGRIGIMYLGELVEVGTVDQIINDPQHPYTKVLLWATPDLKAEDVRAPPLRDIDIPDPADPPSGCRFHTRCMEAREVCERVRPESGDVGDGHRAACFRTEEDHEYWESETLEGTDEREVSL